MGPSCMICGCINACDEHGRTTLLVGETVPSGQASSSPAHCKNCKNHRNNFSIGRGGQHRLRDNLCKVFLPWVFSHWGSRRSAARTTSPHPLATGRTCTPYSRASWGTLLTATPQLAFCTPSAVFLAACKHKSYGRFMHTMVQLVVVQLFSACLDEDSVQPLCSPKHQVSSPATPVAPFTKNCCSGTTHGVSCSAVPR